MLRRDERFAQAIVFLLVFVSLSPNYAKININSTIVIRLLVHRFLFETFCSFYSSIEEFSFFKSEPVDHHVRLSLPRFLFLYFLIFFFFFFTKFRFVSCLVFFSNHAYHSPPDLIVPVEHAADFRHFHPFFPPPSRTFVSIFFFRFFSVLFFLFLFFSLSSLVFNFDIALHNVRISRTDPYHQRRKCFCEPVLWSTTKRRHLDVICVTRWLEVSRSRLVRSSLFFFIARLTTADYGSRRFADRSTKKKTIEKKVLQYLRCLHNLQRFTEA